MLRVVSGVELVGKRGLEAGKDVRGIVMGDTRLFWVQSFKRSVFSFPNCVRASQNLVQHNESPVDSIVFGNAFLFDWHLPEAVDGLVVALLVPSGLDRRLHALSLRSDD